MTKVDISPPSFIVGSPGLLSYSQSGRLELRDLICSRLDYDPSCGGLILLPGTQGRLQSFRWAPLRPQMHKIFLNSSTHCWTMSVTPLKSMLEINLAYTGHMRRQLSFSLLCVPPNRYGGRKFLSLKLPIEQRQKADSRQKASLLLEARPVPISVEELAGRYSFSVARDMLSGFGQNNMGFNPPALS